MRASQSASVSTETTAAASAQTLPAATLTPQVLQATVYTDASLQTTSSVSVTVEGQLPREGQAVAYAIDPSLDDLQILTAYDITVYTADGTKFEPSPDAPLTIGVTIPGMPDGLTSDQLSLLYLPTDAAPVPEKTPVEVTDTGVSFTVEHLSTYVVTITNVNGYTVAIDGVPQTAGTVTGGASTYNTSVTSTYVGQQHSLTIGATNTNLVFTSITQGPLGGAQGPNLLSAQVPVTTTSPFSYTLNFTNSTTIILKYNNSGGSGTTTNVTITFNITVNQPTTELGIKDTIASNGLLTAVPSGALAAAAAAPGATVTYTWVESTSASGPWSPVDPQAISSDGSSVNVAVDGNRLGLNQSSGRMYYQVSAVVDNGAGSLTGPVTSAAYQVPYYMSLQNGSFETPKVATTVNYGNFANGTAGLIWRTTAQDGMIELGRNATTYNLNGQADGPSQFAELNANYIGTLYQDVLVTPGEILTWTLAHAGRNGQDTMNVIIMPEDEVPADPSAYPTATGGNASVTTITDGKGPWNSNNGGKPYSGTYTVPAGVYLVRFLFVSVSAVDPASPPASYVRGSEGNLLDAVTFRNVLPYTVEYYLNGVLQTALTETGAEPPNTPIAAGNTISGAKLQQVLLNGRNLNGVTSFNLLVPNSVLQLYYVDTGLVAYKEVTGVDSADMPPSYPVTFELYGGAGTSGTLLATATLSMIGGSLTGSVQFMTPAATPYILSPSTTYTVKEVMPVASIAGYDYLSTASGNSPAALTSSVSSVTFTTVPVGASIYEVYFRNDYEKAVVPFSFTKTTGDLSTALPGVDFMLYPLDALGAIDASQAPILATSDTAGLVDFGGLKAGDYKLVETQTGSGYQLPLGDWTISVSTTNTANPITIKANGSPPAFSLDTAGERVLPNYQAMTLPLSGQGYSILLLTTLGIILVGTAVLMYTTRKRRGRSETSI